MTCVFTPKGHKGDPMSYNEFRQFLLENPKYWADVAQKYAPDIVKIHNLTDEDIKQAAAQAPAPKPEVKAEEKPKPESKKEEAPKEEKKPEGKPEEKPESKQEKKPEGKPEEKPESKQEKTEEGKNKKTLAQRAADNLRSFAKAIKETTAARKENAAVNVGRSLRYLQQDVLLLSNQDFQEAAKLLHARNGSKYSPSADGWYFYRDGVILINKDVDVPDMPDVIVFHEGTHPVINIIRNSNPELYNKLLSGAKEYKAKNPTKFLRVDQFVRDYNNPNLSPEENQARMDDELIVETIAQIASGNIKIDSVPFSFKQSLIDFLNKVIYHFGGAIAPDFRLNDTSDERTFMRVATGIAVALKEGRDIENLLIREVGLDRYFDNFRGQGFAPNLMGGQARQAEKILNAKDELPKFKALNDVAEWLADFSRKNKIVKKDLSEASDKQIVDALVDHTKRELEEWEKIKGDYEGFYDEDIPETLNPELVAWAKKTHGRDLTNEEISLYHVLASFASPSATPVFDSNIGLQIFNKYLNTGEISAYGGKQATVWAVNEKGKRYDTGALKFDEDGKPVMSQIARAYAVESLNKFKKIIDHFKGDIKKAVDWIESEHSYKELSDMMGTPVKGAKRLKEHENLSAENGGFGVFAISGPKLGSYVLNRVGNYSTVTKDLWYARTMARLFGEPLIDKNGEVLTEPWANTVEGNRKRKLADQAWEKVAKDLNTKPAIIQQRIWDLEKKIWQMLGAESSAAGKSSEGLRRGIEVVANQPQASYGRRTIRANAIANAATELANLIDETGSLGDAAIEFRASAEFDALSSLEATELLDSLDAETRQQIGQYFRDRIKDKIGLENSNPTIYSGDNIAQFNEMGRLVPEAEFDLAERERTSAMGQGGGQPQASMGSRDLPASVRDQIRDVIAKEKVNAEKAGKEIRKILEAVPNLDKASIDEMVQKYEERIGAKTEAEYFFDYIKEQQALNKLNPMQARALLKQFRNFLLSPEDLDNAMNFVDKMVKNKALLDKVNQSKQAFRMLKTIAKNKKLSKADKLFLANLATPKFYLCDEAELIKLREMALNFISSRLNNAEQKFTMAEIDAAYNEAAAKRPAKERAKPKGRIKTNSRPIVELAVTDALKEYSSQLSVAAELSKMDLSVLDTDTLFRILNALKVYDETGVLFDLGQITEMARALNSGKKLKGTAIRGTISKLAAGGISAKLQSVAAGANEIRRILVGGWDRNAARVTSDTQSMREDVNKKFSELKIGLPERFLLGAYGFFKEQSKSQTMSLKADVLADQMNYLRERIKNAKQYSSSASEMRMLEHYYNGAIDALVKLGAIKEVNGEWAAIEDFDIESAVPKNVKEAWDYTQKLLQEKTQEYAEALRLYHGRDFDLIQDYFPRSFYKVDVSSGDIAYGQGDQLPEMGSIDPVINKQSTDLADRNRGRSYMPWDGGFYILDGYETAMNGLWDINATIHLSKDYAYTNALVNQGSIVKDAKTNDAVKKYLISSVSGILRDPMLFPDTRAFFERFSDTAINSITSTILNNRTQFLKQPIATTQGFIANPKASTKAAKLMRRALGDPALAEALNKFFNNTSAPYAEQLAYNELETKYYQGDYASDKARGFLNKISPESLVAANKFTQKQLLLTGYLAERGSDIDFIKEAVDGFDETALASAENFAEAANSTANRHFLPLELKNAKAYKKWLYFLSTYTFVATAQFWNNMGILTKPGYTGTQKRMAGVQAGGFLMQQLLFQIVTRGIREGLYEIGEALGWLEEEDEEEETKNQEKYWYQILAGIGIDTIVGPYASFFGDSVKYIINSGAELLQDKFADTEEEEKEKLNLLYSKKSELPGAFSILEPLWKSGGRAIKNGDESEYWALGIQAAALALKIGDLYLIAKMKTRALESIFATADSDKLLRTMRTIDSGQYKNWASEVRGAGVPDDMLSKLTYKVGDMGYYVDASDAKKFMSVYNKYVEQYSKTIKQNAKAYNLKISDNEIKRKAEKIAEKQAQMQVKKVGFKLPENY